MIDLHLLPYVLHILGRVLLLFVKIMSNSEIRQKIDLLHHVDRGGKLRIHCCSMICRIEYRMLRQTDLICVDRNYKNDIYFGNW